MSWSLWRGYTLLPEILARSQVIPARIFPVTPSDHIGNFFTRQGIEVPDKPPLSARRAILFPASML
jgi:hypothetical protein